MTNSDFLLVRIIPTRPTTAAAFRAALNQITITASDKTVFDTNNDRVLGKASGLAAQPITGAPSIPLLTVVAGNPPTLQPSIIQHFALGLAGVTMLSVATAVIVINRAGLTQPDKEYPTPTSYDVSLALTQASTQSTVASRQQVVDYNVQISTDVLAPDQLFYTMRDTTVYLSIDVPDLPLAQGTSIYSPAADGTAPHFDFIVKAIDNVLGKDSPTGAPSLEAMKVYLTTAQARQVAAELVNNRQLDPPPAAPYPVWSEAGASSGTKTFFEDMFTIAAVGDTIDQTVDQARTKFVGDRASYYALRTSDAIQLANYVYSAIFSLYAELYTFNATRAIIDARLALRWTPPFTVPAAFFYALTTTYAISQDFDTRIKILLTATSDSLTTSLGLAIDSGVLGPRSGADGLIWRVNTSQATSVVVVNNLQAIRRITALQASVRDAIPEQVYPAANASVKKLITDWLNFTGQDADLPATVWYPAAKAKDYLTVILEVIAPGAETLISTILSDLRLPPASGTGLGPVIQNVTDLAKVTETQWLEFYTRNPGILPQKYVLGDLKSRVHTFVQDVTKILFTSPSPQSLGAPLPPSGVPMLDGTLDQDVLVAFFAQYTLDFTSDLDATKIAAINASALQLFQDEGIASFVTSAVLELWTLYNLTALGSITNELRFSYMEALHARGFTSAEKVQLLQRDQFILALTGTVAYGSAGNIWDLGSKLPSDIGDFGTPPGDTFSPINPGDLTNCEPPCHLSPFGPFQYLKQLLGLTSGSQTVGGILAARRGPLSNLIVNADNLSTPLPAVDLVNENLESLVSNLTANAGAIYNTENTGLTSIDVAGIAPLAIPADLSEEGILKALPQHSSPHLPQDQPTVYSLLASTMAGPDLPYSQTLDISRSYLCSVGTSRFEVMRVFHRDTTEFAIDASKEPADFQKAQWRLPVRYDIALEYLGIAPEEALAIYSGNMTGATALGLLGVALDSDRESPLLALQVSVFLCQAGITYCEFLELQKSGIVPFGPRSQQSLESQQATYPECLPCCDDDVVISFPGERSAAGELLKLMIFIRLWKSLRRSCATAISMATLADICAVLGLFTSTNVNPEFLRQLASLLMLHEWWHLPWGDKTESQSTQPDSRTTILSLWSGNGTDTHDFKWAVEALLDGIEKHAVHHYKCPKRSASWKKLLASNFDALAELAGFIETTWYAKPTCTIRFVEILTKLYASTFTVGEILFLFTTKKHLRADDPFPFTEEDESLDDPFNVPEDDEKYGLWALRRKLLDVEVCDEETDCWSWHKIEAILEELGYTDNGETYSLKYLAEHFFPDILEECGCDVSQSSRYFTTPIRNSTPQIWPMGRAENRRFYV
ncbi:hypothetical protein NQ176_g6552 [Zarea fungicola]|uniref:Uncharacterized protein n=1 Tax=Zarea fungicola TaxID=93591 RepID=A0ACC1N2Q7_9HYPO|nr:hypothetical protein NQ176_g6552 [Lecanicillium fungicola]